MSSQKPDEGQDDEIWRSLFGENGDGGTESKAQQKKGYTTLQTKDNKRKSSRHDKKRRKIDDRSRSSRPSQSNSSQQEQEEEAITSHETQIESHSHSQSTTNGNKHINDTSYHQDGPSTAERLSQFLCTPKNRARLPPPPLKCKFLKYPHSKDRFTKYCATNLELNYNWDLHHDSLFPLPLDLMDPDYYNPLKNQSDYDEDEQPLNRKEDERILQLLIEREYKRTAKEEQPMPEQEAFLLQTQYLTGGQEYELTESQRKVYDRNDEYDRKRKNNKKRGSKRRREYDNNDINDDDMDDNDGYYNNYSSNIRNNPHSLQNVKQTFLDIQSILPGIYRHPRKDTVAEKVYDVFPHDGLLEIAYTHVQFDKNPSMHTKKCSFMPKFHEERMKMAELCTTNALLRCVNKKQSQIERERNSKQENDDLNDDDDEDDDDDDNNNNNQINDDELNKLNNADPDWFSLYSSDGKKKKSEYDDEEIIKYEWTSEYAPIKMDPKPMRFLIIPSDTNNQCEEVYYANLSNRISLRHRPTDSSQDNAIIGGKKGLSEEDKKFFKQQPKNIRLNVPRSHDSDDE